MGEAGGMDKLRVGLIFGGRSVEHEVSVASATSISRALDPQRYEVTLVAIDHEGRWHRGSPALPPEASVRGELVNLPVAPGSHTLVPAAHGQLAPASDLDVIIPIVHGRGGEDGSLQACPSPRTSPTSARACSARRSRWTRRWRSACCAPPASRSRTGSRCESRSCAATPPP